MALSWKSKLTMSPVLPRHQPGSIHLVLSASRTSSGTLSIPLQPYLQCTILLESLLGMFYTIPSHLHPGLGEQIAR